MKEKARMIRQIRRFLKVYPDLLDNITPLSEMEKKVYSFILSEYGYGLINSHIITSKFGLHQQSVYRILKSLYDKGYIKKYKETLAYGNRMVFYKPNLPQKDLEALEEDINNV